MQSLHEALPDPMCLEATLTPPTTPLPLATQLNQDDSQVTKQCHVATWADTPPFVPCDHEPLLGPDGEIWLPKDPFHSYDSPSTFDPETEWSVAPSNLAPLVVHVASPPPSLSPDAEANLLPHGLLHSPLQHEAAIISVDVHDVGISSLCAAIINAPP
jgi:hypothetical protein